jgi:hypothetical protein
MTIRAIKGMAVGQGGSMRKRLGVLGAGIALVALAVGVVGPASGSSGDDDKRRMIRFVAVNTENDFLDLGEKGETLGDVFAFTHQLRRRGEQVGQVSGVCTTVSVAPEVQCVVTASLPQGQITAQALLQGDDIVQAITGGTGRYTGAEGHIFIEGVSLTREIWTFHLED